jgi:hypothetical protein
METCTAKECPRYGKEAHAISCPKHLARYFGAARDCAACGSPLRRDDTVGVSCLYCGRAHDATQCPELP